MEVVARNNIGGETIILDLMLYNRHCLGEEPNV